VAVELAVDDRPNQALDHVGHGMGTGSSVQHHQRQVADLLDVLVTPPAGTGSRHSSQVGQGSGSPAA
jgi:hypothetical protein